MENQIQVFHPSHRPLKIPQNQRDFPISTALTMTILSLNPKTKERKSAATRPPHSPIPLSLRSSGTDFMLIFRLENATGRHRDHTILPKIRAIATIV
jgi:hypothetical protein